MDSASEFLRVLQQGQAQMRLLSTVGRALHLRLAHAGQVVEDVLLPLCVHGRELVCGGIDYRIACLAASPALPLKELIALPAELQFVTDRGTLRSVCGIVTEARAGDADGSLACYELVLRDALAVMEKRTGSRIFRYQNELEIVQVLCEEWRQSNPVLAAAFELELDPLFDMRQYPPREQTMQYNESDAAFVRRLLKRRGVGWTFRPGRSRTSAADPVHDRTPAHTLVLFADAASLPQNGAGSVRYHRDGVAGGRDTVTAWTAARRLQPGVTTRHSWDYKNPGGAQFMLASSQSLADQGPNGSQLAATLDDYLVDIPHAGNDVEDGWRLGQVRMSRHELESKCFQGEATVRDFCAGQYFTLEGHPEIDQHPAPERDFVITELEVRADNNLPRDLQQHAGLLKDAAWTGWTGAHDAAGSGQARVQVRFTAVRRGIAIVPAFDPRVDLPHPQLQSAIVVGPPDEDVHCDALGRVKIRFPGMRASDHRHAHGAGASGTPADSAWVRVASSWAGNGNGAQHQSGDLGLPRVGSEVLVAFLGGDPDRPIVLAQLYNGRALPPAFSGQGALPGNRYVSGTRTREIGGMRGNQLRFDDTRGEISAQLASDHGNSELNLGWLTQPRVNGEGAPRGEGAELRSDLAVALRGGQGVLISAGSQAGEGTGQLERAGLVGLVDVMHSILDEVGRLATDHTGDEASDPRLAALADKLKRWHAGSNVAPGGSGGDPILAATAPAGVVVASSDNLALGAGAKVDVVSAGDAEVSTGRNLFLRAARGLSAFAHELGVKLVAGRGNIVLHTHRGDVEIKSSGHIRLVAAEGIEIDAPAVKVVGVGAQTDWRDGSITHQSSGKQVQKGAEFVHLKPGDATPEGLNLPNSRLNTDEYVVLRHRQTDAPMPNQRYMARLADGRTVSGRTDAEGRTSLLIGEVIGDFAISFLPD